MKSQTALLLATLLLPLAGCNPALNDPPPSRAERSGVSGSDAAQSARREALSTGAAGRTSADSTATMGAAPEPRGPSAVAAVPSATADKVDDAQISAGVRAELAAARDLGDVRIDVDARDGIVTLSGPVRSLAAKIRASEIARGVRGVVEVNDQLTLVSG